MTDVTAEAEATGKTAPQVGCATELHGDRTPLDRRYGKIGISAVAAAARYASGASASRAASELSSQKSDL